MPIRIDHIIIAAPDLALLEEAFTHLGFRVVGGGEHPHLGTRNRIIILGESYIELLTPADVSRASRALLSRIERGAGWVGYALQSEDIDAETEAMRARGVDARGPVAGRLLGPGGAERGWRNATIGSDDLWAAALPLPFLIQHGSEGKQHQRELAGPDAQPPGAFAQHPNGAMRIVEARLSVTDFDAIVSRYEQAFALPRVPMQTESGAEAGSRRVTFALPLDGQRISLEQPQNAVTSVSLAVNADTVLTPRLMAPDTEAVQRLAWQAGFAATPLPNGVSVAIPGVQAALEFVQGG